MLASVDNLKEIAAKTSICRNSCNGIDLEVEIDLTWLGTIIRGFQIYRVSGFDFYSLVLSVSQGLFICLGFLSLPSSGRAGVL